MNPLINLSNYPPLIELTCKEIKRKDFKICEDKGDEIGSGAMASVFKGRWNHMDVAIKKYSLRSLPNHLRSEFNPHCIANHENIVRFYGVCTDPGKFAVITELLPLNLCAFFANFPKNDRVTSCIKMRIASGVAKALIYLHSMNIRHGHIKETNVFLDKNFCAKLGNHGLSRLKLEASSAANGGGQSATVRWRAYETFTREYSKFKEVPDYFKAVDVYSLGVILWQLEARTKPFPNKTEVEVVRSLCNQEKLEIDKTWAYAPIIEKCLNTIPEARPTAQEVLNDLRKLDLTKVYLIFLKNTPSVYSNSAMKDVFPLIANYIERIV